ncbi:MAG: NAD(P)H-hydrate dehydratase [Chloroflexi bacterium]|nr:NAD(P)H-hydrate dehydratase [Chloroflexota bacterium]
MKIVTSSEMRELDRQAGEAGLPTEVLMENAGLAFANAVERDVCLVDGKSVVVLVGPGNNGGDGLVAARHFHDRGAQVSVWTWKRQITEADANLRLVRQRGIPVETLPADSLLASLRTADIVVDSLLGVGLDRPVSGDLADIIESVNSARSERGQTMAVVALDIPTGLNADTGQVMGTAIRADLTVTLGYPKAGFFIFPGPDIAGKLATAGIGLPEELGAGLPVSLTSAEAAAALLPARPAGAHKGVFGKVLVIGGSINYIGAPVMASISCLRAGAGLTTLATARGIHPIVASKLTEVTFLPLPETDLGVLGPGAVDRVAEAADDFDTILLGPGIGRDEDTVAFVQQLLQLHAAGEEHPPIGFVRSEEKEPEQAKGAAGRKMVIDADGLNALSESGEWWKYLPTGKVLTPHAGELSRLTGQAIDEIEKDRINVARDCAQRWGQTVVLKGPYTVVASPGGEARLNPFASSTLATGGSGDVLSGTIAGLMAQGLDGFPAAVLGTYLHAMAAKIAAGGIGDVGVLASEISEHLPLAIRELTSLK